MCYVHHSYSQFSAVRTAREIQIHICNRYDFCCAAKHIRRIHAIIFFSFVIHSLGKMKLLRRHHARCGITVSPFAYMQRAMGKRKTASRARVQMYGCSCRWKPRPAPRSRLHRNISHFSLPLSRCHSFAIFRACAPSYCIFLGILWREEYALMTFVSINRHLSLLFKIRTNRKQRREILEMLFNDIYLAASSLLWAISRRW